VVALTTAVTITTFAAVVHVCPMIVIVLIILVVLMGVMIIISAVEASARLLAMPVPVLIRIMNASIMFTVKTDAMTITHATMANVFLTLLLLLLLLLRGPLQSLIFLLLTSASGLGL